MIFSGILIAALALVKPYSTEPDVPARTDALAFHGLTLSLTGSGARQDPQLLVRVTNTTSHIIQLRLSAIAGLDVVLRVVNASGAAMSPTKPYVGPLTYEIRDRPIFPSDSRVYSVPLSAWGYHLAPGTYRVSAILHSFATKASLESPPITVNVSS